MLLPGISTGNVNGSGGVGIGYTSFTPSALLDVEGGTAGTDGNGANIKLVAGIGGCCSATNGGNVVIQAGTTMGGGSTGTIQLLIGNVGIGTTNPALFSP